MGRRFIDRNTKTGKAPIHLTNAWSTNLSIYLAQLKQSEGSNRIVSPPEVLDYLDLSTSVVSTDVIECQEKMVKTILSKQGHCLLSVKNKQKTLLLDIQQRFDLLPTEDSCKSVDKGHSRLETRRF